MKKILKNLLVLGIFWISCVVLINIYIISFSKEYIYSDVYALPQKPVWLVLGASVLPSGRPSGILQDRLDSAADAYNTEKFKRVENILVSGDNSREDYNESDNMAEYLMKLGVPEEDIYIDYAGFDTYDSMYRAQYIFGVEEMAIFTQEYHLSRSIYIARKLGIDAIGYVSDKHQYMKIRNFQMREVLSRVKAFFDVEILKSKPKFLGERIEVE